MSSKLEQAAWAVVQGLQVLGCACTLKERDSGHRVGCAVPEQHDLIAGLLDALARDMGRLEKQRQDAERWRWLAARADRAGVECYYPFEVQRSGVEHHWRFPIIVSEAPLEEAIDQAMKKQPHRGSDGSTP